MDKVILDYEQPPPRRDDIGWTGFWYCYIVGAVVIGFWLMVVLLTWKLRWAFGLDIELVLWMPVTLLIFMICRHETVHKKRAISNYPSLFALALGALSWVPVFLVLYARVLIFADWSFRSWP